MSRTLAALVFAAISSSSAMAAVATDLGATRRLYFYEREGEAVIERACPADTAWPSSGTCTSGTRRVAANAFFADATTIGPRDAAGLAEEARTSLGMIQQLDVRLAALLETPTDPAAIAAAQAAIEAKNRELAAFEAKLRETERQIGLIREALANGGAQDPDLGMQLSVYEERRIREEKSCQALREQLATLEDQLVAVLQRDEGGDEFRDLVIWRDELVRNWRLSKERYGTSLTRRADAQRLVAYVGDANGSLPTVVRAESAAFESLKPWAAELEGVFERAAIATGVGVPSLWIRAVRLGSFRSQGEPRRQLTLVGFKQRQGGAWAVEFSGFPDMESECYEGATRQTLNLERISAKTEFAICRADHTCQRVDIYENAAADRNFRMTVDMLFRPDGAFEFEMFTNCGSHGPGSVYYWMEQGLPRLLFPWR